MFRRGHQPGARVAGNARLRPLLERRDQRILCEVFRDPDVANDAREAGDEPGRLDSPDRVDGAMGIGSRHRHRSHHLVFKRRKREQARPRPRRASMGRTVRFDVEGLVPTLKKATYRRESASHRLAGDPIDDGRRD